MWTPFQSPLAVTLTGPTFRGFLIIARQMGGANTAFLGTWNTMNSLDVQTTCDVSLSLSLCLFLFFKCVLCVSLLHWLIVHECVCVSMCLCVFIHSLQNDGGITHTNNSDKTMISAQWTAPNVGSGNIEFRWATVQVQDTHWANEEGPVLAGV